MSTGEGQLRSLMPSVLDRLATPASTAPRGGGMTISAMLRMVSRDLEALLNARRSPVPIDPQFAETRRSVATFGFPDISTLQASTPAGREEIARWIESVIRTHEPRLKDVRARMLEPKEHEPQSARLVIDAKLNVSPGPPVAFETILNLASGIAAVRSERT
jgi:type VI secretion system protein ImpF